MSVIYVLSSNNKGTSQAQHDSRIGRGSSVSTEAAWHIIWWRLGHENISTAIFPLLFIQEEHLSVNAERMYTKHW